MKALTRKELFALRATIKGFAAESQSIRKKRILPNRDRKRAKAWEDKRTLGYFSRVHLLAYSFMRGFKREDLEKVTPGNKSYYYNSWTLGRMAKDIHFICRYFRCFSAYRAAELTEEAVKNWLLGGENIIFTVEKRDATKPVLASLAIKLKKMAGYDV